MILEVVENSWPRSRDGRVTSKTSTVVQIDRREGKTPFDY